MKILGLPRVEITQEVLQKLWLYVNDISDKEIQGMGRVLMENGVYRVVDVHCLEPESTSCAYTEIGEDAMMEFMQRVTNEGKDYGEYRFWWHSHAKMNSFFSGTDESTIRDFKDPYIIAMVINSKWDWRDPKSSEYKLAIQTVSPFEIRVDDINYEIEMPMIEGLKEACKAEIDEHVRPHINKFKSSYSSKGTNTYRYDKNRNTHVWDDWDDERWTEEYGVYAAGKADSKPIELDELDWEMEELFDICFTRHDNYCQACDYNTICTAYNTWGEFNVKDSGTEKRDIPATG